MLTYQLVVEDIKPNNKISSFISITQKKQQGNLMKKIKKNHISCRKQLMTIFIKEKKEILKSVISGHQTEREDANISSKEKRILTRYYPINSHNTKQM